MNLKLQVESRLGQYKLNFFLDCFGENSVAIQWRCSSSDAVRWRRRKSGWVSGTSCFPDLELEFSEDEVGWILDFEWDSEMD